MPTIVNIPSVGRVHFPDDMSMDEVTTASDELWQKTLNPKETDLGKGRIRSAASEFARTIGEGAGELLSAAGRAKSFLTTPIPEPTEGNPDPAQLERNRQDTLAREPLSQIGAAVSEAARETYKPNPRFVGEFLASQLPQGIASTLGAAAPGAIAGKAVKLGRAAGALVYGTQQAEQQAQEAEAMGHPEQADMAFVMAAPIGVLSEAFLGAGPRVWSVIRKVREAVGDPAKLPLFFWQKAAVIAKESAKSGVFETAQESIEQVGQNAIAKVLYDEKRELGKGVGEAAAVGGAVGALFGAGGAAGGIRESIQQAKAMAEAEREAERQRQRQVLRQAAEALRAKGAPQTAEALETTPTEPAPPPVVIPPDLTEELQRKAADKAIDEARAKAPVGEIIGDAAVETPASPPATPAVAEAAKPPETSPVAAEAVRPPEQMTPEDSATSRKTPSRLEMAYKLGVEASRKSKVSTLREFDRLARLGEQDYPDFGDDFASQRFWEAGLLGLGIPKPVKALRIGPIPASGTSTNFREQQREKGVSVLKVAGQPRSDTGTFDLFNSGEAKWVDGFLLEHARGSDGEPLIVEATNDRHSDAIESALKATKPVSAAAVDEYGIKLPSGYVREGDRYVYKPPENAPSESDNIHKAGAAEAVKPTEATPAPETPNAAVEKADAHIDEVAETRGKRPAKEIKSELVSRLEEALKAAPTSFELASATPAKEADTITIDIPGDGTFTIVNTKEVIEGVLKKAKKISLETKPANPTAFTKVRPTGNFPADIWVTSSEPTHDVTIRAFTKENGKPKAVEIVRKGKPVSIPGHESKSFFLTSDGNTFTITEPQTGLAVGSGDTIKQAVTAATEKLNKAGDTWESKIAKAIAKSGQVTAPSPIGATAPTSESVAAAPVTTPSGQTAEEKLNAAVNEALAQESERKSKGLGIAATGTARSADTVLGSKDLTSVSETVEKRWQDAVRKKPSILERLSKFAEGVWHSLTRQYAELNENDYAKEIDILRRLAGSRNFNMRRTVDILRGITQNLGPKQYNVFSRVAILEDLAKDVENGMYDGGKDLPFGYTSDIELQADLDKFTAIAQATPQIQRALALREQFMNSLRDTLVERGFLPESVKNDPRYFHHQVLFYMAEQKAAPGSKSFRDWFSGWTKSRTGSALDYNRQYIESEAAVISDAFNKIALQDYQAEMKAAADITAILKSQVDLENLHTVYGGREKFERAMALRGEIRTLQESEDRNESYVRQQLAALHEERNAIDPLWPFVRQKAIARAMVGRAIAKGEVADIPPNLQHVAEALAMSQARGQTAEDIENLAIDAPEYSSGEFFAFMNWLSKQPGDVAAPALSFFKAIQDQKDYIKKTAGDKFKTVRSSTPKTHTEWQPKKGNLFYPATTVAEKAMDDYLAGLRELLPEDFKEALAVGGRRETWIIPKPLAKVLDQIIPPAPKGFDRLAQAGVGSWKRYILFMPLRFAKYSVNNFSGDVDFVLAANPRIFKYWKQAIKDVYNLHLKSGAAAGDVKDAMRDSVIGSGWRQSELPDVASADEFFSWITGEKAGLIDRYWKFVGKINDVREDSLRLAAYRFTKDQLADGKSWYGASVPSQIDKLGSNDEKAAKIARELMIDYGKSTEFGQFMRQRVYPFWKWQEGNFARYAQLIRNVPINEGGSTTRAVGAASAGLALRMAFFYAAFNIWNHILFPKEEEEMGNARNQLHAIFGRNPDGSIRSLRVQGSLSDVLGWIGAEDFPSDVSEVASGKSSIVDKMDEAWRAAVSRIVNGSMPFAKTFAEATLRRSWYPDATHPRPVRDPYEHVARLFSLGNVYRYLVGIPSPAYERDISSLIFYNTDPGEAAYNAARHMAADWKKKHGGDQGTFIPAERSNALYYYKQAIRYGDQELADRWKARYLSFPGATTAGMNRSIQATEPLHSIGRDKAKFMDSLSPAERGIVDRAEAWYKKVYRP